MKETRSRGKFLACVSLVCTLPALLYTGCSSSDDESGSEGRRDGGTDGQIIQPPPLNEAGPDAPSTLCAWDKPFGSATPVPGLETNIDIARLTDDEQTVYYNSFADTNHRDLFVAKRSNRQSPFAGAKALTGLNDAANDTAISVTGDDKLVVYSTNRGDGYWRLFWAQRSDPSASFGSPTEITGFNLPRSHLTDPVLFSGPEGVELWFRSDGTGNGDIYRSIFTNGVVTSAVAQSALNTNDANELLPVMSRDRLTLYFASSRPGKGGYDIWTARRSTPSDAFTAVTSVKELNTDKDEWPTWMSPDGCRMYLTSTRGGVQATYMAERTP